MSDILFSWPEFRLVLGSLAVVLVATWSYWRQRPLRKQAVAASTPVPVAHQVAKQSYYGSPGKKRGLLFKHCLLREDDTEELDFSGVTPYKPGFDYAEEEPIQYYRRNYISDRVYSISMGMYVSSLLDTDQQAISDRKSTIQ